MKTVNTLSCAMVEFLNRSAPNVYTGHWPLQTQTHLCMVKKGKKILQNVALIMSAAT
jgi:hypothetical protein